MKTFATSAVSYLPVRSPVIKGHVCCGASVSFVILPLGGTCGKSYSSQSADCDFFVVFSLWKKPKKILVIIVTLETVTNVKVKVPETFSRL